MPDTDCPEGWPDFVPHPPDIVAMRGYLSRAAKDVLAAREMLRKAGALMLAGECSACDTILCELIRPTVIEQALEEERDD